MQRAVIALVALAVSVGCASAARPTLVNRLVRQGTPTVDVGGPRLPSTRLRRPMPPPVPIATNVSRVSAGSSLEASDPALRAALNNLLIAPTADHHLKVAAAYRRLGILDGSYEYLQKTLAMHGPDPAVYDAIARLWRDWGNPALGLGDAYRAVALAPRSAAARNTLGTLLYRLGRIGDAEAQFKAAVGLDAYAWYAYSNLCHVSMALGRTLDAIGQCRRAESLQPKLAERTVRE
jgi:tetratricopeptide (TPR) repeat protein